MKGFAIAVAVVVVSSIILDKYQHSDLRRKIHNL
jgi:hypothetical protein